MPRRETAVHETGHAFFSFRAGAPLQRVYIAADPAMGDDEWEGEVCPGGLGGVDAFHSIMTAYGGPLAEAKLRLQGTTQHPVRFDYANNELNFINGSITDPRIGGTSISFVEMPSGRVRTQPLLTASFRGDVRGHENAPFELVGGQTDLLVPLCQEVRRLLDLPAIWGTVLRFAGELELNNDIRAPQCRALLQKIFEEETALAARELWIQRGTPLWDDQRDWFVAQGSTTPVASDM